MTPPSATRGPDCFLQTGASTLGAAPRLRQRGSESDRSRMAMRPGRCHRGRPGARDVGDQSPRPGSPSPLTGCQGWGGPTHPSAEGESKIGPRGALPRPDPALARTDLPLVHQKVRDVAHGVWVSTHSVQHGRRVTGSAPRAGTDGSLRAGMLVDVRHVVLWRPPPDLVVYAHARAAENLTKVLDAETRELPDSQRRRVEPRLAAKKVHAPTTWLRRSSRTTSRHWPTIGP